MHRTDAPGHLLNRFSAGNPATGQAPTQLDADWSNAMQEAICGVIEGAGMALVKYDDTQLLNAILALTGAARARFGFFLRTTPPPGWLHCNGAAISRTAYAALYADIAAFCGPGDGVTTFTLPDLRGEFFRGWDAGRGIDIGRVLGSWQDWATGAPRLTTPLGLRGDGTTQALQFSATNPSAIGFARATKAGENLTVQTVDTTDSGWELDAANVVTGDAETRPRNFAALVCIKY